ncbi:MAG: RNA polymerase sigma factor [Planctomycetota bacterium]
MLSNEFDELMQRGFRYALSLTHDRPAAEDLLQDACLRVSRRGGPWHAGYLLKAIRNGWIDSLRRGKLKTEAIDAVAEDELIEPAVDYVPLEEMLEGLLGRVSARDRELLFLSAVEGYTAAEIGGLTGRPRGTILSALFRAKQKLRRLAQADLAVDDAEGGAG